MRRLVYSPEVFAFIRTDTEILNISPDIIGGSITRRVNAPSTASLTIQNRKLFYNGRLLPMDRIVIILKKTQPILVFSGYLDSAPYANLIDGPAEITASCTLKRLEFTYYDPTLPSMHIAINEFFMDGNVLLAPGSPQFSSYRAMNSMNKKGKAQDVGFGKMLHWLVTEVGGWDRERTHILPIPENWLKNADKLFKFKEKQDRDVRRANEEVLRKILTSTGVNGLGTQVSEAGLSLQGTTEQSLNTWMSNKVPGTPLASLGSVFIQEGIANGVHPEFLVAVAYIESSLGTAGRGKTYKNPGNIGNDDSGNNIDGNSWENGIRLMAEYLGSKIRGGYTTIESYRNPGTGAPGSIVYAADTSWPDKAAQTWSDISGRNISTGQSIVIDPSSASRQNRAPAGPVTEPVDTQALAPSGEWEGTKGPAYYLYNLARTTIPALRITSEKRSTSDTDHGTRTRNAYALDMAVNYGDDVSQDPQTQRSAQIICDAIKSAAGKQTIRDFGINGGNFEETINGLRFQLIWLREAGGDPHRSHFHLGIRNTGGVPTSGTGSTAGVQPARVQGLEFHSPLGAEPWEFLGGVDAHGQRAFGNWESDSAVDMGCPPDTPVYACFAGSFNKSKDDGSPPWSGNPYGDQGTLTGPDGYKAFYTHCEFNGSITGPIQAGQLIGKVGKWEGGPTHLHFGFSKNGSPVDPQPFLEASKGKATGVSVGGASGGDIEDFKEGMNSGDVFNAIFSFPGDYLESIMLMGERALMNDKKLIEIVQDIANSGLRVFASHPNGDFMSWFPDYFNASGRNPYFVITENELIDCQININDANLATHVYVTGDTFGFLGSDADLDLFNKLTTWGIMTIETAYLLDSFISRSGKDKDAVFKGLKSDGGINKKYRAKSKRSRELLDDQRAVRKFLQRYGARPYTVDQPSVQYPLMEFFLAYHEFQKQWAKLFQSNAEFTFMPELFPGTIIKIKPMHLNFYVSEVTHNFDYSSGFTTTATLEAPSTDRGYNPGMALVGPYIKGGRKPVQGEAIPKVKKKEN